MFGFAWVTGIAPFNTDKMPILFSVAGLLAILFGIAYNVFAAAREEIGWRGLLVPELARFSDFTQLALISGVIWTTWHFSAYLLRAVSRSRPGMVLADNLHPVRDGRRIHPCMAPAPFRKHLACCPLPWFLELFHPAVLSCDHYRYPGRPGDTGRVWMVRGAGVYRARNPLLTLSRSPAKSPET